MTTAIYFMRLAGYCYVGKRQNADAPLWAGTGTGTLPDGYRGSGTIWRRILLKHGWENIAWAIVDVVEDGWQDAERRWVGWAKEWFGKGCVNITNGGEGVDSETAKAFYASLTPEQRSERSRKAHASLSPEQRSERARKAQASQTPEQRSESARKAHTHAFENQGQRYPRHMLNWLGRIGQKRAFQRYTI